MGIGIKGLGGGVMYPSKLAAVRNVAVDNKSKIPESTGPPYKAAVKPVPESNGPV